MRNPQHEIPTHLNVEDKLLFGLTARQFLYVLSGASAAYALWEQLASAPQPLRLALTALCLLLAAAVTLLRPGGRPLEEWLVAGLIYIGRPRRATWRPREPELADWRPAHAAWQELAPSAVWAEDEAP
jgi:PrgI family protein